MLYVWAPGASAGRALLPAVWDGAAVTATSVKWRPRGRGRGGPPLQSGSLKAEMAHGACVTDWWSITTVQGGTLA